MLKLAIYYGYPSSINSATNQWDLDACAADFGQYDMVVLGAGLQDSGHADHNNTVTIMGKTSVANTDFFGYVTMSDSTATIKNKIDDWDAMGVAGIFCDEYGYDFGITRAKQNEIVDYIHNANLAAFVNSWDVDDALDNQYDATYNSSSTAHNLGSGDWYLAESYQINNGSYDSESTWTTKADKMATLSASTSVKIACITTEGSAGFSQQKMDYAYFSTIIYGFHAFGWGEENYAASDAVHPFRTRISILGTKIMGSKTDSNGVHERHTNIGIHVDTVNHTVSTTLD